MCLKKFEMSVAVQTYKKPMRRRRKTPVSDHKALLRYTLTRNEKPQPDYQVFNVEDVSNKLWNVQNRNNVTFSQVDFRWTVYIRGGYARKFELDIRNADEVTRRMYFAWWRDYEKRLLDSVEDCLSPFPISLFRAYVTADGHAVVELTRDGYIRFGARSQLEKIRMLSEYAEE